MIRPYLISFSGPIAHPILHPVAFRSFPPLYIVTVRYQLSSIVEKGMWIFSSYVKKSYTSSDITKHYGYSSNIFVIYFSSCMLKHLPVGLWGEFKISNFVLLLIYFLRISMSNVHYLWLFRYKGTVFNLPPAIFKSSIKKGKAGSNTTHSSPGLINPNMNPLRHPIAPFDI